MRPNRQALIRKLLCDVHKALCRSRSQPVIFRKGASIHVEIPGLLCQDEVIGVPASFLLTPPVRLDVLQREGFVWEILPYLPPESSVGEGRMKLLDTLGSQCSSFIMAGRTAESRLVRLLWLMGSDQPVEHGPEKIVISGPDGQYGVEDGKFVGGPFAGMSVVIDTTEILFDKQKIRSRSASVLEARRVLVQRRDPDAYFKFQVLYAISQWDKMLPIDSLVLSRGAIGHGFFEQLETKVLQSDEPYKVLHAALVPSFMTHPDFYNIIGSPKSAATLNVDRKLRLMAKVRSLPFFE